MEAGTREGVLQSLPPEVAGAALAALPRGMAIAGLLAAGPVLAQQMLGALGEGDKAALLSHLSVADAVRLMQVLRKSCALQIGQ